MSELSPSVRHRGQRLRRLCRFVVTLAISGTYCLVLLGVPPASWKPYLPEAAYSTRPHIYGAVRTAYLAAGIPSWGGWELRESTCLLLLGGAVPWLLLALVGRGRPSYVGLRRPNRLAMRLVVVSYLVALFPLVWLALKPAVRTYYLPRFHSAGAVAFLLYYLCNMLSEHFVVHGLLLAVFRPGFRWPASPGHVTTKQGTTLTRTLQWLGIAQPRGGSRGLEGITRWIGLPGGCVPALIGSTAVFGLLHLGKDPRELLLSLPGGLALAFLAYRTNSWLTPFLLHLATAGTAFLLMAGTA